MIITEEELDDWEWRYQAPRWDEDWIAVKKAWSPKHPAAEIALNTARLVKMRRLVLRIILNESISHKERIRALDNSNWKSLVSTDSHVSYNLSKEELNDLEVRYLLRKNDPEMKAVINKWYNKHRATYFSFSMGSYDRMRRVVLDILFCGKWKTDAEILEQLEKFMPTGPTYL